MIFARKMSEFYIIIARKIFFPNFRGHVPHLPPSPTPTGIGIGVGIGFRLGLGLRLGLGIADLRGILGVASSYRHE